LGEVISSFGCAARVAAVIPRINNGATRRAMGRFYMQGSLRSSTIYAAEIRSCAGDVAENLDLQRFRGGEFALRAEAVEEFDADGLWRGGVEGIEEEGLDGEGSGAETKSNARA
jgi:hypothetical protein